MAPRTLVYGRLARPGDSTTNSALVSGTFTFPAVLSTLSSFAVALTFVLFRDLRRLRYIEIMFYVSVSNFVASLGASLGPSRNYSPACWFQGLVTNICFLTACFWVTVLSFQLWYAVMYGGVVKNMFWTHVFVWTAPVFFALMPLTTNSYGAPDGYSQKSETEWCFIVTCTDDDPAGQGPCRENESKEQESLEVFWDFFSFYLWIILSIAACFYFVLSIFIRLRSWESMRGEEVKASVWKLMLYPVILIFSWFYTMIIDIKLADREEDVPDSEQGPANFFPCFSGFLFSLVFFYVNDSVRKKWRRLFLKVVYGVEERRTSLPGDISRRMTFLLTGMPPTRDDGDGGELSRAAHGGRDPALAQTYAAGDSGEVGPSDNPLHRSSKVEFSRAEEEGASNVELVESKEEEKEEPDPERGGEANEDAQEEENAEEMEEQGPHESKDVEQGKEVEEEEEEVVV